MYELLLVLGLVLIFLALSIPATPSKSVVVDPLARNRAGGIAEYSDVQHSVLHKGHK